MRKVLFRTDASPGIGIGHLIRSVALAQYLRDRGIYVRFLTVPFLKEIMEYLNEQGFDVMALEIKADKLGENTDFDFLSSQIKEGFDWVVLDGYYFGYDYQQSVADQGVNLLFIDDTAKGKFTADILLNHGVHAHRLNYNPSCVKRFLLGPEYALIRKELTPIHRDRNIPPQNILITLGGGDNISYIKKILDALAEIDKPRLKIKVLGGFSNLDSIGNYISPPYAKSKYLNEVKVLLPKDPSFNKSKKLDLEFHQLTFDVGEVYEWTDLAVCAAGGTCWELSLYGITGVIGILADNQRLIAEELGRIGAFRSIGWYRGCSVKDIVDAIKELLENHVLLDSVREKARSLVDGKGPERVYQAMEEIENEKG